MLTNIAPAQNYVPPRIRVNPETSHFNGVSIRSAPNSPAETGGSMTQELQSPTNIEVVAQTLQSYQTGTTTILDFARDAKLANLTHPELNAVIMTSNAAPLDLERMVRSSYEVPKDSPWKVYESGYGSVTLPWPKGYARRWKHVVGDVNRAICILSFDEEGMLREKTPVQ